MNTFLTDHDFSKSAANLDQKRLGSQIYEGIHMLSSLLGMNDQLVNPKRSVINHPATQLWVGYEPELGVYIYSHLVEWMKRGYKSDVNRENFKRITKGLFNRDCRLPEWITEAVLECHRSVLIQKKKEYYGPMWPECARGLTMRYDWRKNDRR